MSLKDSIDVSATGLRAQAMRMRVIAENLANADSVAPTAGGEPYRRKIATFEAEIDRADVHLLLAEGDGGEHLMTYHPYGPEASSTWLHDEPWLDINMIQSGHARRAMANALRDAEIPPAFRFPFRQGMGTSLRSVPKMLHLASTVRISPDFSPGRP